MVPCNMNIFFFWLARWNAILYRDRNIVKALNKATVRPAKTQISLGIRPVWSESALCAYWVAKDPSFFHGDSEDSDQTARMPRMIWVFAGRTVTLLVLSCQADILTIKVRYILQMFDIEFYF